MPDGAVLTAQWEAQGAIEGLNTLMTQVLTHFGSGMADMEGAYPRVRIGTTSYRHKVASRGVIHKPTFEIVGWEWGVPGA